MALGAVIAALGANPQENDMNIWKILKLKSEIGKIEILRLKVELARIEAMLVMAEVNKKIEELKKIK